MKVLFCVNIPSPYRVDFFNELGLHCELTVCYERNGSSERHQDWIGERAISFREIRLQSKPLGVDRTLGTDLWKYIRKNKSDILVLSNYASPSVMYAITMCRLWGYPFYLEGDGGFFVKDSFAKGLLKKFLINGACGFFTTSEESIKYLKSIGFKEDFIYKYPFSSVKDKDIVSRKELEAHNKELYKQQLGIVERKMILAVGQFIQRKGFDVLLKAVPLMKSSDVGVYIVGGVPTDEYKKLVKFLNLTNVHFVGFKKKTELALYYKSADVVAFPTREDIWGLVTNEGMSYGVPVISTNRCISALEMIEDGKNGFIVRSEDERQLAEKLDEVITKGSEAYSAYCLETSHRYTIETMVDAHLKVWNR